MDDHWLTSLENTTCLLVPTRSLQSDLHARVANHHLALGHSVWPSPSIITWADYLTSLWQANRHQLEQANSVINADQSRLLWERVIEQTKRKQDDLTLLNVPQTARAAQRSWQLASDWQIETDALAGSPIEDTHQFGLWCNSYEAQLKEQCLLDSPTLLNRLFGLLKSGRIEPKFGKIVWYGFDLTTAAQSAWCEASKELNIIHEHKRTTRHNTEVVYHRYTDQATELRAVLSNARALVERDANIKINVVVPDFQQRQAQIQAVAADVFYPGRAPLDLLNNDLAYRFSLGQPLADWSAITAALKTLNTLSGQVGVTDLSWLLRNRHLRTPRLLRETTLELEHHLQRRRITQVSLTKLPVLLEELAIEAESGLVHFAEQLSQFLEDLQQQLVEAADRSRYRTLKPHRWRELFNDWLALWGWSTALNSDSLSSVQFQLLERWQTLLASFEGLSSVQYRIGLRRALELLQRLSREQVFLPKAAMTPIYISGVYEALGMPSDVCFVTGMSDQFPAAARLDPFIANQLHDSPTYPSATPSRHLQQARGVIDSLLHSATRCEISFTEQDAQDASIKRGVSSLFRLHAFEPIVESATTSPVVALASFIDTQAPAVSNVQGLRGGTRIFTNQSNCAFKAFASHRLSCDSEQEAEFGLDPAERGNVVHLMLEKCWQRIQSKAELDALLKSSQRDSVIDQIASTAIAESSELLSQDKHQLLGLEHRRLSSLLLEWLTVEAKRPCEFSVASTEEAGEHILGGIRFKYKIDRVDFTAEGHTVIIDYKTGHVNRNDLHGERLREPQLPLYVQAVTKKKNMAPAGIALAQVKAHNCNFTELSEANIFPRHARHAEHYAQQWSEATAAWPQQLTALAEEFFSGHAPVNPIDEKTCLYCDLSPLCRVKQHRDSGGIEADL